MPVSPPNLREKEGEMKSKIEKQREHAIWEGRKGEVVSMSWEILLLLLKDVV